jgi:AraC-like DNA-binding protein
MGWHPEDEEIHYLPEARTVPSLPLMIRQAGESRWRAGIEVSTVDSEFFSVEIVLAGNMHLRIEGKSYLVEKGQAFLLRRGANFNYSTGPAGYLHKLFIGIMGAMIDSIPAELGLTACHVLHNVDIAGLAAVCRRASRLLVERPANLLIEQSLACYRALLIAAASRSDNDLPPALVSATKYLKDHVHQRLRIQDLADTAGIGTAQLYRLFKRHVGETPIEMLTRMKMEHAQTLLLHTPMQIKQIAHALGFEEAAYFANTFKKVTGVSPNVFRSGHQPVRATQRS